MTVIENTPSAWSRRSTGQSSWGCAGWSEQGQTQRFQAVLRHLDLRAADSLLDYGCGTGRLSVFVPREVDYYGYDPSAGMRDRAAVDHPDATILSSLPDMLFDHVVCVGPFNLPGSIDATYHEVADLWHMAVRHTLAISLYRGDDPRCIHYTPADLTDWVRRLGATRFLVSGEYLDNDLLLVLRK